MQLSTQEINDSALSTYLQSVYNFNEQTTELAVKVINKGLAIEEVITILMTKGIKTLELVAQLLNHLNQEAVTDAALGITNYCKSLDSEYAEHHNYAYDKIKSINLIAA